MLNLTIKSQASGMPHEISEHLGSELRNLAFICIMRRVDEGSSDLVNAMKSVFAELGVLSDLFETDSGALNDLLKGQKEAEEIVTELKSLQNESESIKSIPSLTKINSFVERVKKLDRRIKAVDLDSEIKTTVRENLCYMARGTAIELHNTKHQTSYALTIAKALVDEFGDMPALRVKLTEDLLHSINNSFVRTKEQLQYIHQVVVLHLQITRVFNWLPSCDWYYCFDINYLFY